MDRPISYEQRNDSSDVSSDADPISTENLSTLDNEATVCSGIVPGEKKTTKVQETAALPGCEEARETVLMNASHSLT